MIVGPTPPFKSKIFWAIRIRLKLSGIVRDLALFNLAIDSKLRTCDLVGCVNRLNDRKDFPFLQVVN
jgi:hypothetical protein